MQITTTQFSLTSVGVESSAGKLAYCFLSGPTAHSLTWLDTAREFTLMYLPFPGKILPSWSSVWWELQCVLLAYEMLSQVIFSRNRNTCFLLHFLFHEGERGPTKSSGAGGWIWSGAVLIQWRQNLQGFRQTNENTEAFSLEEQTGAVTTSSSP